MRGKKILAAMVMLLGLTACAPDKTSPEIESVPDHPETQETTTLTCYINHTWYVNYGFTGIIPEEITRQTGIALEVTVATDNSQLGGMLASQNLPDLIYSSSMLGRLSNSNVSLCYDDLIQAYEVDWEISSELRSNALTFSADNRLYTVLNHYSSTQDWKDVPGVPMTGSLLVRQDILDALGNPPLGTLEDLMEVYALVREAYPDMIPLVFDGTHRFNVFLNWFGMGTVEFVEQEGDNYLMRFRDSRYREMLNYLNQLYRKGFLLADNFASEESMTAIPYRTGKAFSYSSCTQNSNVHMQAYLQEIDKGYNSVELAPLEGAAYDVSDIGWSGTFITVNNAHPKESIQLIAWMFTPEAQRLTQWGREGVDYIINGDGMPIFTQGVKELIAQNNHTRIYNPWFYFGGSAIVEAIGRYAVLDTEVYEQTYTSIRNNYKNNPWVVAALPMTGEPEKDIYDKIINSYMDYETKVILSTSDQEFEENYTAYMRDLNRMGVEQLEEYMTRRIAEIKPYYIGNDESGV